jgi:uncharacterized protein (TIGR03032 family)
MENQEEKKPALSVEFSPVVAQLLEQLGCTLMASTYQGGKVLLISSNGKGGLTQLARNFQRPMGIDYNGKQLLLATRTSILLLSRCNSLAASYPRKPNTYDTLLLPRIEYHTGYQGMHDVAFGAKGIFAINTLFSCVMRVDPIQSFVPIWKPSWITEMMPEDRCHLNGMAMYEGKPRFVTCFNDGNEARSWKPTLPGGGMLIDIETNEILLNNLEMPHSPRIFGNDLFLLTSGNGDLLRYDLTTKQHEVVINIKGFVRGMDKIGDFIFIGISKFRESDKVFSAIENASSANYCAIKIVQLSTRMLIGEIRYTGEIRELYDIKILPGIKRANIFNHIVAEDNQAIMANGIDFWRKTEEKQDDEISKNAGSIASE